MKLDYPGKQSDQEIISSPPAKLELQTGREEAPNRLVEGDNLPVMLSLFETFAGKVDLVYIDPPFATGGTFRVGAERAATVSSSRSSPLAYTDHLDGEEYLEFLRRRLVVLRELMAPHASLYLHIDCKVGHYVKIILDEVFGAENFRSDITRIKCNPKNFKRRGYGNMKDMLLFYSRGSQYVWHEPMVMRPVEETSRLFNRVDSAGRRYTTNPLHAPGETRKGRTGQAWRGQLPPPGRHWRVDPDVLDEMDRQGLVEWSGNGVPRKKIYEEDYARKRLQDIWDYKDPQWPEYPTEKNLEMLKIILQTSSDPGMLVMDCFCGSGGTLVAATQTGRHWLGIDQSPAAIQISQERQQTENLSTEEFSVWKQVS